MQYHLECPHELQEIERKLLVEVDRSKKELHPSHAPTFITIIETRIALLKEILSIIEDNSNMTEEELVAFLDHKLEAEENAMYNSSNVFDTDRIFTNVRILEWIKYLIMEKNGRVTLVTEDTD
ncbi:MAG TPA: hypothetical protein VH415_09735 [Nitrososphaeraceae archaeon]|jgi:hypothetical protein